MASLDYRSHQEPIFLTNTGGLEQGSSTWIDSTGRSVQRPALHELVKH